MKQFTTAARRGSSAVNNAIDITFEYEVREGEFVEMTAHPPTTGQMALFAAHQTEGGLSSVRAVFDLLACVLGDEDYKIVEDQLYDGLDISVITDIVNYLIGEWSARPTTPPTRSSAPRSTTGRRSTAKRRAGGSTTST